MPRILLGDKTTRILRSILADRGLSGAMIAEALKRPKSTINAQIKNAESMPLKDLRRFVDVAGMTDSEIVKVVRG